MVSKIKNVVTDSIIFVEYVTDHSIYFSCWICLVLNCKWCNLSKCLFQNLFKLAL